MFATLESGRRQASLAGIATLSLLFLAAPAAAQRTPSGAEVWGANCGRCHRVRAVDAYDARQWETVVAHMALVARLTPDEAQAVREFLVGAARSREARPEGAAAARRERETAQLAAATPRWVPTQGNGAPAVSDGLTVFTTHCVVCHGDRGKGNGPVAASMNPKPADLTNPARMSAISNDSLAQIISKGRGAMPGLESSLTPAQVRALVDYVRTLKP